MAINNPVERASCGKPDEEIVGIIVPEVPILVVLVVEGGIIELLVVLLVVVEEGVVELPLDMVKDNEGSISVI